MPGVNTLTPLWSCPAQGMNNSAPFLLKKNGISYSVMMKNPVLAARFVKNHMVLADQLVLSAYHSGDTYYNALGSVLTANQG